MNVYKNKEDNGKRILCIYCATIFFKSEEGDWHCINCDSKLNKVQYSKLHNLATEAVHFGYTYRKQYESDLEKGKSGTHYCLFTLNEAIAWLALAAISGIIGNISTDLTKTIIKKIIRQASEFLKEDENEEKEIFENEEEIEIFLQYLEDYKNGLPGIHPSVKKAILAEIQVDEMMKIKNLINNPLRLQGEMIKAQKRSKTKLAAPISEEEFKEMWKHVDLSA